MTETTTLTSVILRMPQSRCSVGIDSGGGRNSIMGGSGGVRGCTGYAKCLLVGNIEDD